MVPLDSLFKEFSDGVCISNAGGNVLYMNPTAQRLLDIDATQAKSLNLCDLLCGRLHLADNSNAASHCVLRHNAGADKAATFQGRHGPKKSFAWKQSRVYCSEQWKDLRARCVKLPPGLLDGGATEEFFTLIEDVGAESELERHKEEWRGMIAHDLRAPLTNIAGALAILAEIPAGRPLLPEESALVGAGLRASRHMLGLLNLFLEVAKLDAGAMPVHPENISVAETVQKGIEHQSTIIREKNMKVEAFIPADLAAYADSELFLRVIRNILNNALKFTPAEGQVTISASGTIRGKISISVKDTGPGIAPQDIPHVFDRYYQAKARQERRIIGNGLGLAFCQQALKVMGGDIAVDSELGSGTEFIMHLPSALHGANAIKDFAEA